MLGELAIEEIAAKAEAAAPKRRVVAGQRGGRSVDQMIEDAHELLAGELDRLRKKVVAGNELTSTDVRAFEQLSEVLLRLAKEERDRRKDEDAGGLTDEELLAEAQQAVIVLRARIAARRGAR